MAMKMNKGIPLATFLLLLLISIISTSHSLSSLDANSTELSFHNLISSTVLPLTKQFVSPNGIVGGYTVSLKIGYPGQSFDVFIDTGSDLTWVQCNYECKGCTMDKYKLYKLHNNFVQCGDPLCVAFQKKDKLPCVDADMNKPRKNLCAYKTGYVDGLQTKGFLVQDNIPLESSDRTLQRPKLAFGCTNILMKVTDKKPKPQPIPEGILGLGHGETSILSQLKSKGLIKNVVGHCLSDKNGGGGYLFFGDNFIPKPPSQISWIPMQSPPKNTKIDLEGRYFSEPANLIFDEKPTFIKFQLIFDSGTTLSAFNSKDHKVLVDLINKELNSKGKFTQNKPKHLTCWSGGKKFTSIDEVKEYLKPIILRFPQNLQFQLLVEDYIIISNIDNICLTIEDGGEVGFKDINVIGAFSMTNKLMIFDNEEKRIGWVDRVNCDKHPSSSQENR